MLDVVMLALAAGDGGDGRVSFRREKFVPKGGPDGGDAGDGGDVIIRASRHYNTLAHLAGIKGFEAEPGQAGGKRRRIGRRGQDLIIEVPLGTTLWLLGENTVSARGRKRRFESEGSRQFVENNQMYYLEEEGQSVPVRDTDAIVPLNPDQPWPNSLKNIRISEINRVELVTLAEDGQSVVVCRGGHGGKGNEAFKGPANTTPLQAQYGTFGEKKQLLLELKLLADIGLVGLPNAGKSTLLSVVTKANPRVDSYPFTTIEPNLGVWSIPGTENQAATEIVLADLPGLIEGASEGKGLGYIFLRHIEACKALLYILALDETQIYNDTLSPDELAAMAWAQWQTVKNELAVYDETLTAKPFLVLINKSDLLSPELRTAISNYFVERNQEITFLSGATKVGLDELAKKVRKLL